VFQVCAVLLGPVGDDTCCAEHVPFHLQMPVCPQYTEFVAALADAIKVVPVLALPLSRLHHPLCQRNAVDVGSPNTRTEQPGRQASHRPARRERHHHLLQAQAHARAPHLHGARAASTGATQVGQASHGATWSRSEG